MRPSLRCRCVATLAAGLLLAVLAGCTASLAGDWRLASSKPNRETFAIDQAHFGRDGTYSATFTLDGRRIPEKGSFQFTGFKLTFRPNAGGSRTYNAVKRISELELRDGERVVVLRKS
ncbi:MAG: hypothetical protein HZB38_01260 [Planctomycetes bacterium]|nr:hypothetical protein [Planctomycetota bacterium]